MCKKRIIRYTPLLPEHVKDMLMDVLYKDGLNTKRAAGGSPIKPEGHIRYVWSQYVYQTSIDAGGYKLCIGG